VIGALPIFPRVNVEAQGGAVVFGRGSMTLVGGTLIARLLHCCCGGGVHRERLPTHAQSRKIGARIREAARARGRNVRQAGSIWVGPSGGGPVGGAPRTPRSSAPPGPRDPGHASTTPDPRPTTPGQGKRRSGRASLGHVGVFQRFARAPRTRTDFSSSGGRQPLLSGFSTARKPATMGRAGVRKRKT